MERIVLVAGVPHTVEGEGSAIEIDGERPDIALEGPPGAPVRTLRVGSRRGRLVAEGLGTGRWILEWGTERVMVEVLGPLETALRAAGKRSGGHGPEPLRAPMPGRVVRIDVGTGGLVEAGSCLLVVEAMKMENELRAGGAGRVRRVHVIAGETVEKGQLLVEFEAPESDG